MNKSIKYKFVTGFIKIFCVALLLLFLIIGNAFERSNENIIIEQMKYLKESSEVYIWKYLLTHHITPTKDALYLYGKDIMKELSSKNNYTVAIYNKYGMLLFCSDEVEREQH